MSRTETPLISAIQNKDFAQARRLVDDGANVDEDIDVYPHTPLVAAIAERNLDIVKLLVDEGANVNWQGGFYGNALQTAVSKSHRKPEIVKFLIDRGAKVNQEGGYFETALTAASTAQGSLTIVKLLLDAGADVNQSAGSHVNALITAVIQRNLEVVKYLAENGADVCLPGPLKWTSLHYAVEASAVDIVEFLLGKNARPDAQDDTGITPLDLAIGARDANIIPLLLTKMERPPLLSAKLWRSALHLERAGPLMFTFKEYLSIESIDYPGMPPQHQSGTKVEHMLFFRHHPNKRQSCDNLICENLAGAIPEDPVCIIFNDGMLGDISPSSKFRYQWWRRQEDGAFWCESSLPRPNLCKQLGPRNFLIESWFTISCFAITDNNWPSHQVPIPQGYDHLTRVEGFFWVTTAWPLNDFTHDRPIEELLRPVFSVTTCGDTPVKLIRNIEDLLAPLIGKFDFTFEENCLRARRQLSKARLEVLRSGGRDEDLIHRLLSDATVIEYMTENHAHIVRSMAGLIDCVAGLQNGPWKLPKDACEDGRKAIDSLKTHLETLRELMERSQSIIQLEFNLASILEARRSTSTNRSLKRLTWVTFVYLPLLFVASLFGMNVDILSDNPSWRWYFPVAGGFFLLTFGVWIVFKRSNTLEGNLERYFAWLVDYRAQANASQLVNIASESSDDKESAYSEKSTSTMRSLRRRIEWRRSSNGTNASA